MAIAITHDNIEKEILQADKPAILDIYASWCGPCQQMAPILEELEREFKGKYIFAQLNVDEARDIAIKYGVTSVPTFIFFNKGQVVSRETGYMSKETFKEKISQAFGS